MGFDLVWFVKRQREDRAGQLRGMHELARKVEGALREDLRRQETRERCQCAKCRAQAAAAN